MMRFENVWVADGTGKEPFRATVLADGAFIAAVEREKIAGLPALETVDGRGMILAPGFIDAHGHSDLSLIAAPGAESKITQGVTTEIAGNCGLSAFPLTRLNREHLEQLYANYGRPLEWTDLASYMAHLRSRRPAMRLACLCGHNTLRAAVAGYEKDDLDEAQLAMMEKLLDRALADGAPGLSAGLLYVPGKFAGRDELVRLLRVLAARGGVFTTHLRSEGDRLLESLTETFEYARLAGVKKVQISHFKTAGKDNWSKLSAALRLIEDARRSGIDVTVDRYPYLESMTQLSVILPPPWDDLGDAEIQKRLRDPETRVRLADELRRSRPADYWRRVRLAASAAPEWKDKCGSALSELGNDAARTVVEIIAADAASACGAFRGMSEDNLKRIMALDYCMPGSDGNALPADGSLGTSHPRSFGAIAKFIRRRLDDSGSVGDAVGRATGLPARVFGLTDRGTVAPGNAADLVLFDPDAIDSAADFAAPRLPATGIAMTVTGGRTVFRA
jgi:N-acyl-D-amino-acid deacylase